VIPPALGVQYELLPIRQTVEEWAPHIVVNLLEEFHSISEFDAHVVSYLDLLNPRDGVEYGSD
jgi:hypothetical protein